jgi:hypothetical protein
VKIVPETNDCTFQIIVAPAVETNSEGDPVPNRVVELRALPSSLASATASTGTPAELVQQWIERIEQQQFALQHRRAQQAKLNRAKTDEESMQHTMSKLQQYKRTHQRPDSTNGDAMASSSSSSSSQSSANPAASLYGNVRLYSMMHGLR